MLNKLLSTITSSFSNLCKAPKPALAFLPALEFAITLIVAFRMFRRMSLPEPIRGIDRWSRRADAIGNLIGFAFALRAGLTVRQAVYVRAPLASSFAFSPSSSPALLVKALLALTSLQTYMIAAYACVRVAYACLAALLQPVWLFILLSFSFSMTAGWCLTYYRLGTHLCASWLRMRNHPRKRAVEHALNLQALSLDLATRERLHRRATDRWWDLRLSSRDYRRLSSSDAWRGLKQSWYALLHTSSDKIIYQSARWMFLFMPLSFPARWLSPLTLLPFLLEATDSMVSEHLDRYTPPTLANEPKVFIQRLSGIFLQTFLPLPTLKHLFVKPDVETLSAVFLTPFNLEATNPTDPSEWPALNELGTLAPRLPPPHPALLGFLHALECFVVATAVLGIGSSGRRVDLEELVGVALEEVRLRRRANEAEQKAHEAILEAVLAWKARKEGR